MSQPERIRMGKASCPKCSGPMWLVIDPPEPTLMACGDCTYTAETPRTEWPDAD